MVGHRSFPEKFIELADVLTEIKRSAFVASKFPVILHADVHCRAPAQEKAIEVVKQILGPDNIFQLPDSMTEEEVRDLLSPEQLREKFMLKCIRPRFLPKRVGAVEDELALDDNKPSSTVISQLQKKGEDYLFSPIMKKHGPSVGNEPTKPVAPPEEDKDKAPSERKMKKLLLSAKLIKAIYFTAGMKLDLEKFRYPWEVASISGNKLGAFMEINKDRDKWLTYCTKHLACVTPSLKFAGLGTESVSVASCNMTDPMKLWQLGTQMVGVFRALKDDAKAVNDAIFSQGGCNTGYVLKHSRLILEKQLLSGVVSLPTLHRRVKITLLSVNQVPREFEFGAESSLALEIALVGAPSDAKKAVFSFQTDGYRYEFDKSDESSCTAEFSMAYPLEAVFVLTLTCDGKPLCKSAFPAAMTRHGYRVVPLCDLKYKRYAFSCVFGRFEIEDEHVPAA
ncbi:MAG: phosphatidylinositol-specific phospholipase C domain-containing protein [Candidatus Pacebacteria bacterium]|nr:phosphatidylinositol-specific phospholipase C domain-containing protein [Candidatus Paceibacterota bacterium]